MAFNRWYVLKWKKGREDHRMRRRDYAGMDTWYILMQFVDTDHK
jgi:hypothetical protein